MIPFKGLGFRWLPGIRRERKSRELEKNENPNRDCDPREGVLVILRGKYVDIYHKYSFYLVKERDER